MQTQNRVRCRTQKELAHQGNEGLPRAVELLAQVKVKVPELTHAGVHPTSCSLYPAASACGENVTLRNALSADLYQLAGIVAVESAGGPTIPFTPGKSLPAQD